MKKSMSAELSGESGFAIHAASILFLGVLIFLFYWPMTFGLSMPVGDATVPLSYFNLASGSYNAYGELSLWNPFAFTGSPTSIEYMVMSVSPLNPILRVWLFMNSFFHFENVTSFYIYLFLHVYIGAIASYALGVQYFFKNVYSSLFFAIMVGISGYVVSAITSLLSVVAFGLFPVVVYFCYRCAYENSLKDYFFLAFSMTVIAGAAYPVVTIAIGVGMALLYLPAAIGQFRKENLKSYGLNIGLFLVFLILLNIGNIIIMREFTTDGSRYLYGNLGSVFYGKSQAELLTHSRLPDVQMLFHTFIPSNTLAQFRDIFSDMNWGNSFYYLSVIAPALAFLGFFYLVREKKKDLLIGFITLTIFFYLYAQGYHFLFRLHPKLFHLSWYGRNCQPLVIFGIILFVSFGFHALFSEKTTKPEETVPEDFPPSAD